MKKFLIDEYGMTEDEARQTIRDWFNHKSNKELWIEEQERMEEENND